MYVSNVFLQNWKNFRSTEAPLRKRVFLIGPNAAGKSNLLDAFRFLRDVANSGLASAVGARGGVSRIRCLAARESPSIAIAVTLANDDGDDIWRYHLEFNQDLNRVPKVRKELVTDLRTKQPIKSRPDGNDEEDPLLLTQTALEQIVANRGFRPIAEFFGSISYQHVVPQVVRDPKGFSPTAVADDPYGRDLLRRIWNTASRTRDAWLKRICAVLSAAVPQLKSLEVEMDSQGTPHLVGRYEHWRAHDARQNESQFSDGTLRLFGLMWSMFEGSGPLLLEEPELSLHPEIVRQLPQLLVQLHEEIRRMKRKVGYSHRQVIVCTHSDEMLRDKGLAPTEVLRLEPSMEGSVIRLPSSEDKLQLDAGLTAADVLLPQAAPKGGQISLLPFLG